MPQYNSWIYCKTFMNKCFRVLRAVLGTRNQQQPRVILCILQCSITSGGWVDEGVNKQISQALLWWPDDLWEPNSQGQGLLYRKLSHNQLLIIRAFTDVVSSTTWIFSCLPERSVAVWESTDQNFVTSVVSPAWSLVQRSLGGEAHGNGDFHLWVLLLCGLFLNFLYGYG